MLRFLLTKEWCRQVLSFFGRCCVALAVILLTLLPGHWLAAQHSCTDPWSIARQPHDWNVPLASLVCCFGLKHLLDKNNRKQTNLWLSCWIFLWVRVNMESVREWGAFKKTAQALCLEAPSFLTSCTNFWPTLQKKCERYWPEKGDSVAFGPFTVRCVSTSFQAPTTSCLCTAEHVMLKASNQKAELEWFHL